MGGTVHKCIYSTEEDIIKFFPIQYVKARCGTFDLLGCDYGALFDFPMCPLGGVFINYMLLLFFVKGGRCVVVM